MAISLQKGAGIDLRKIDASIVKLMLGLGWKAQSYDGAEFDLDASVFMLDVNEKIINENTDFIFYSNPQHPSGSVKHMGDNKIGSSGQTDDEQIFVDLSLIPANIDKLAIVVTIYDCDARRQNFGQVSRAYIRGINDVTQNEIFRYDLAEDMSTATAVNVAEIYRHNGEWKVKAIGEGYNMGLKGFCDRYGVNATGEGTQAQPVQQTYGNGPGMIPGRR